MQMFSRGLSNETNLQKSNPAKAIRQQGAYLRFGKSPNPKLWKERAFWGSSRVPASWTDALGPCQWQDWQVRCTMILAVTVVLRF